MSRKAGLPSSLRLRHFGEEVHFVEELSSRQGSSIGRMVPIEDIEPNPHQPRQQMGDLSELTASVREKAAASRRRSSMASSRSYSFSSFCIRP